MSSPILLSVATAIAVIAIIAAILRRPPLPAVSVVLILLGAALLALAAGGLALRLPQNQPIVVMVDRSASTRGAAYHHRAALQQRLDQLLANRSYRIVEFSNEQADQTTFDPPQAGAIVLFSDGRFDAPALAPPTYAVVDPNLEDPADASVERLEAGGANIAATIRNTGAERELHIGPHRRSVQNGVTVVDATAEPGIVSITARLSGADAWPENDALSLNLPAPQALQRWWIGDGPAPSTDWRVMGPSDLPTDPAAWLSACAVAANNLPADSLTPVQLDRLAQLARDLGGGVVLIGGDRAFGAGGYVGTMLETISPLSSVAPQPLRHWIILVDSSGSMAATSDGGTRWQRAADAAVQLLHRLPPADVASIGSFARTLRWWSQSRLVGAAQQLKLPPVDVSPSGPTNLQTVVESIAAQLTGPTPTDIIVISDGDARIDDPAQLAARLADKRARLHLLATAGASDSPVAQVARHSGGQVLAQPDPRLWADASRQLLRAVGLNPIIRADVRVTYAPELGLGNRMAGEWNRTWLKSDATMLASARVDDQAVPMAAQWRVGAGQVAAFAFGASPDEIEAVTRRIERRPRDPRFSITWKTGAELSVTIDAIDQRQPLNDITFHLALAGAGAVRVPQAAPGRYELSLPAPRQPVLAALRLDDTPIDHFAVAGRYPREFDRIGNDREAMQRLADQTGGAVIEPTQASPIRFTWPRRRMSLIGVLEGLGALSIAAGLVLWRIRG